MLKFFTLLNALFVIIITAVISFTPLNGVSQAEISDKYFHSLTPAGFTFGIWGIIYASWLFIGLKQSFQKNIKDDKANIFLNLSMFLTLFWLVFWHFNLIFLSVVIMVFILIPLVYNFFTPVKDKVLLFTSNLFFAWGIVAFLENISCLIVNIHLSSGFDTFFIIWSFLLLLLGIIINIFLSFKKQSIVNLFVFTWALFGIIIGQQSLFIRIICIIGILIIFIFLYINHFSHIIFQKKSVKIEKNIPGKKLIKGKKKEK